MLYSLHPLRLACFGFSDLLLSPSTWAAEADNLHEAAKVIRESHLAELELAAQFKNRAEGSQLAPPTKERLAFFKIGLMLLGLATENVLKAILLAHDPSIAANGNLKWPGKGHSLHEMATAANLPLSAEGIEILKVLQEFVVWAGRYTSPMKEPNPSNAQPIVPHLWEDACSLFQILRAHPSINAQSESSHEDAD